MPRLHLDPESLRQVRALFAWAWLLLTVAMEGHVAPVATYVIVACVLIAAARRSTTVARATVSTVLLFDAPVAIVTLRETWAVETVVLVASVLAMAALVVVRRSARPE